MEKICPYVVSLDISTTFKDKGQLRWLNMYLEKNIFSFYRLFQIPLSFTLLFLI